MFQDIYFNIKQNVLRLYSVKNSTFQEKCSTVHYNASPEFHIRKAITCCLFIAGLYDGRHYSFMTSSPYPIIIFNLFLDLLYMLLLSQYTTRRKASTDDSTHLSSFRKNLPEHLVFIHKNASK